MSYRSLESVIRRRPVAEASYKSFRTALGMIYEKKKPLETHFKDQIVVGGYKTSNFEMCPKAQLLYSSLPEDVDRDAAEKAAQFLDKLFALEKAVISVKKANGDDVRSAESYARDAMKMAKEAGLEKEHSFVEDHVKTIKSYHKVEDKNPKTEVSDDEIKTKFARPSLSQTPEPKDMDIDNQKFRISRNLKMQRKLKIIDND